MEEDKIILYLSIFEFNARDVPPAELVVKNRFDFDYIEFLHFEYKYYSQTGKVCIVSDRPIQILKTPVKRPVYCPKHIKIYVPSGDDFKKVDLKRKVFKDYQCYLKHSRGIWAKWGKENYCEALQVIKQYLVRK